MATTDLCTIDEPKFHAPVPMTVALDRIVIHYANKITAVGLGHEIASTDAPTAEARNALEARAGMLDLWLQPAGPMPLIEEVAKIMFMPSQSPMDDTKTLIKLYAADLADLPMFAVVKACTSFRHGDSQWRPTQGQIRTRAIDYVTDLAREKRKIESVLRARIVHVVTNAERRAEIAAVARVRVREGQLYADRKEAARLSKKLGARPKVETDDERDARLRELASAPMTLSETALRTCKADARPDRAEAAE